MIKDLSGKRFGMLTVTNNYEVRNSQAFWECECDCGKRLFVIGAALSSGNTKSCGCNKAKRIKETRMLNLLGQRFGRLVVIEETGKKNKSGCYLWKCQCDCGKIVEVSSGNLSSGHSLSCGCGRNEKTVARNVRGRKQNAYRVEGNTVYVTLSNCDEEMICDADDWERLKQFYWYRNNEGYCETRLWNCYGGHSTRFHIEVIGKEEGYVTDHINRNRLDNRKCNLRHVTPLENTWNISVAKNNNSGVTGVSLKDGKWIVQIGSRYKKYYIGAYDTKEEAIAARIEAEKKYQPLPERLKEDE